MGQVDLPGYRSATAVELAAAVRTEQVRPAELVALFDEAVESIDRSGPQLSSVISTNPDRTVEADRVEVGASQVAGLPVLLKDNIEVAQGWCGSAGSLALLELLPARNAPVVDRLRAAGLVPVGAANMAEWANFRSTRSTNGWSARGGLTRNPHALDRSAGGSSSGSAAAVAAGLVPWAVGSETDGSILNPAAMCGVVGIKPTLGTIPAAGVVPISHGQDTLGPFARTVADAAALLAVLTGIDRPVRPAAGLRVGLLDNRFWNDHPAIPAAVEGVLRALRDAEVAVVTEVDLPGADELAASGAERVRLYNDFRVDLAQCLATRVGTGPRTLAELIAFNTEHADVELRHFGQELLLASWETEGTAPEVISAAEATCLRCGREEGIDAALAAGELDAIVVPSYGPAAKTDLIHGDRRNFLGPKPSAVQVAAVAGYPALSVPIGEVGGLPLAITVLGGAYAEPALLAVAQAVESALGKGISPTFRPAMAG